MTGKLEKGWLHNGIHDTDEGEVVCEYGHIDKIAPYGYKLSPSESQLETKETDMNEGISFEDAQAAIKNLQATWEEIL